MRILARSIRPFRSILRCQGEICAIGLTKRRYLANQRFNYTCGIVQNHKNCKFAHPESILSRALSVEAVQIVNGGHFLFLD